MAQLYTVLQSNPPITIEVPSNLPATGTFEVTEEQWAIFLEQGNTQKHLPVPWLMAPIPISNSETSSTVEVEIVPEDWYASSAASASSAFASRALEIGAPSLVLDNYAGLGGDKDSYSNERWMDVLVILGVLSFLVLGTGGFVRVMRGFLDGEDCGRCEGMGCAGEGVGCEEDKERNMEDKEEEEIDSFGEMIVDEHLERGEAESVVIDRMGGMRY